jgi:hypothetical protein
MGSKKSLVKRLLLPFFFVAPAVFCLSFYYYFVRKPLVSNNAPVFKSLNYFGAIKEIKSNKDTVYTGLILPKFYSPEKNDFLDLNNKIFVFNFSEDIKEKQQSMVCANLFRIQKRVNHIKGLRFVSIIKQSNLNFSQIALENKRNVHAGEIWNFYGVSDLGIDSLKQQIFSAFPNFTNDSLKTTLFLVDPNKQIRGYYYGNSVNSVNTLQAEIVVLNGEVKYKRKKQKN